MLRGLIVGAAPPGSRRRHRPGRGTQRQTADVAGRGRRHERRLGDGGQRPPRHVPSRRAGRARSSRRRRRTRTRSSSSTPARRSTMPWLEYVPAVMQIWFPGEEVGNALRRRPARRRRAGRSPPDDDAAPAEPTRRRSSRIPARAGSRRTTSVSSSATGGTTHARSSRCSRSVTASATRSGTLGDGTGRRLGRRRCDGAGAGDEHRRTGRCDGRAVLRRGAGRTVRAARCASCAPSRKVVLAAGESTTVELRARRAIRSPCGPSPSTTGWCPSGEYTILVGESSRSLTPLGSVSVPRRDAGAATSG